MSVKRVALVGSHGLNGSYGGWDQLVNNLCEARGHNISYVVFNPLENKSYSDDPNVEVFHLPFSKMRGLEGLMADYYATFKSYSCDTLLLLGLKATPVALFIKACTRNKRLVVNIGGVEWRRPQFGFLSKLYLRLCFWLTLRFADIVILDNATYKAFVPKRLLYKTRVIPYGGTIDSTVEIDEITDDYPFVNQDFYLSVSRSIEDNGLEELCQAFYESPTARLVLISNFSASTYGARIYQKYNSISNLTLIDGLYDKPILDCIRRACFSYIHTHTQCGSAPSLIEMIVAGKPIISIDVPQNRETTKNQATYFKNYESLKTLIKNHDKGVVLDAYLFKDEFSWPAVVKSYEKLF